MSTQRQLLSVVVPIYFEEVVIPEFYKRAKAALEALGPDLDYELLYVNDGSTDGSLGLLQGLCAQDPRVRVLDLSRNFGHQLAITAGIDAARGDAVVVIDGDLQDPPEVIAEMVAKWREGFKVVYAVRRRRQGESPFKLATAKLYYRMLQRLSDTKIPLDTGDFRLMDRAVVDALGAIREENRYIRGLVSWIGFRQCGILYNRDSRYAGETKFSVKKMLRFALDGMTSFSDKPLELAARFGFLVTSAGFAMALWFIYNKLVHPEALVQGWTTLLVVVLFLGGVQLITIGILGQYIGRIYRETKRRPLYIVAQEYGEQRGKPVPGAAAK